MSTLTRRSLLGAALLTGMAACAPANRTSSDGQSPSPSGELPQLTLGLTYVPDIQFAPVYVAHHFGWFDEEGVSVTPRHHGAQEKLLGALQTGDEDVVFAGGGEMLQGRAEQIPVRNFGTVYQTYPCVIVVPTDSSIQSLADLRGHSIGLPGEYGENWFYLLAVLGAAGLTRDDVDIQSIGYTQLAALTGNKVDSVVGFVNNDVIRFEEANFPIRTLAIDDPPLVSVGFGALDTTISDRRDDLAAMLRGVKRGAELCASDPDQAVQIAVEYVPTLAEAAQQQHALAVLKATTSLFGEEFGRQDPQRWEAMATFFASQGLLSQPVSATDAYTTDITA